MENFIRTPRERLSRTPRLGRTPDRVSARAGALWTAPLASTAFLLLWTLFSPHLLHGQAAAAQNPAKPAPRAATTHRAASQAAHKRPAGHRTALPAKPAAGVAAAPAAPSRPNWPAEQPPHPARVTWDSRGLAIEASNSSLDQILHEVAADTGVQLQGLNQDERIFGNYGPGPAREVLSRLLDGSGYNVLMIGGQGDEPPQQVILTRSAAGSPQPPPVRNNDEDNEGEEGQPQADTPQPVPLHSPFGAGETPGRTPQEIQQEMLMRQQQIEQQREQQQQNNPQY